MQKSDRFVGAGVVVIAADPEMNGVDGDAVVCVAVVELGDGGVVIGSVIGAHHMHEQPALSSSHSLFAMFNSWNIATGMRCRRSMT